MTDEGYNGWTNYATWGVKLVLDNDYGLYTEVREYVAELRRNIDSDSNVLQGIWSKSDAARFRLADWVKDYTEELCGLESDGLDTASELMTRQVISAGLAEVDWDEIAANILSE